jgi:hypothetical protein
MATDYIAVDTLRSYDSEPANSNIKVGEPAVRLSGGGVDPLDPSSDTEVNYVVGYDREGDHNERYDTDYSSYTELYTYKPSGNKSDEDWDDRVTALIPLTDKDVVRFISVQDTGETEPTFGENNKVGFVDLGNGPRLVESGYSTGGTTYSESDAGDFVAVGYVDELPTHKTQRTGYGKLIPVRIDPEL